MTDITYETNTLATFTLTDRWGAEHTYTTSAHPTDEGTEFIATATASGGEALFAVLEDPLMHALTGIFSPGADEEGLLPGSSEGEIQAYAAKVEARGKKAFFEALSKANLKGAGANFAKALSKLNTPVLMRELFKYTSRDGKRLRGDAFNEAYPRNYSEYREAALAIFLVNDFSDFFGISSSGTESTAPEPRLDETPPKAAKNASGGGRFMKAEHGE